jgi:TPR repeat protein
MYLQGVGVERNHNIAMEWVEASIDKMPSYECYCYGIIFYNGISVVKNYAIALGFLQKAADRNDTLSQAQLGLMYLDGRGVSENKYEAIRWTEKSLDNMKQGDRYDFGSHLYKQYKSEKYLGVAWNFIEKAAEEGHGLAQALLGRIYLEGKGIQKNQDEVLKWIERSVRNLGPYECYRQGMKYYNGFGVEKNYNVAMLYLQAAKHKKYTLAQVQIGILYLEGHGVEKSKERAMECFQQSIAEMDPEERYLQGIKFYLSIVTTFHYFI